MKNTLTVPLDQTKFYFKWSIMLVVTIALLLLDSRSPALKPHISPFLWILLNIISFAVVAFFSFHVTSGCLRDLKEPVAVLSPEGILINRFSIIPWDNIAEINTYTFGGKPVNGLGVRLKNPSIVFKQSSFSGKCVLLWPKLLGLRYHIYLSCFALENQEILAFAQQFLNKKI